MKFLLWTCRFDNLCPLLACIFFISCVHLSVTENVSCDNVKYTLDAYTVRNIPKNKDGMLVQICGEGHCCTAEMQQTIAHQSKQQFDSALSKSLSRLSELLRVRATKFDENFRKVLQRSQRDLDQMFKKAYGMIYEQNAYIFSELFTNLEKYYDRGEDITEVLENFFTILYQKMFSISNQQFKFDDRYLDCASDHMKQLRPFGDVPSKIVLQLKRSFVASHAVYQALKITSLVVANMQRITMSSSCDRAVAKMTHCPACSGLREVKPCSNYCTNVMKGCLAYHSILDKVWNNLVDAMDDVLDRLLGPFDIDMVVAPLDVKISDAIMTFQVSANRISEEVIKRCGSPVLRRTRRGTGSHNPPVELNPSGSLNFGKQNNKPFSGDSVPQQHKLIKDIRSKLKDTKGFWQKLPYQMCGTTVAEEQESCWNGHKRDKYSPPVVGDGMPNQVHNPEVSVDINRPNSLVNEQAYTLRVTIYKLKEAYNGREVMWADIEESTFSGSGSGMGSGYGDEEGIDSNLPPERNPGVSRNDEDNSLNPIPENTNTYRLNSTTMLTKNVHSRASLNKALFSYLMPIVMVWYGHSVHDMVP